MFTSLSGLTLIYLHGMHSDLTVPFISILNTKSNQSRMYLLLHACISAKPTILGHRGMSSGIIATSGDLLSPLLVLARNGTISPCARRASGIFPSSSRGKLLLSSPKVCLNPNLQSQLLRYLSP